MKYLLKTWRVMRIPFFVLVLLFVGLVVYRIPFVLEQRKTAETVAFIQEQRITMDDVTGTNLPPSPDPALVDATIEGIDANTNGIRDDVELAIFERYPDDSRLRSAMLQYAKALQLYLTHAFNEETWKAGIGQLNRSTSCLSESAGDPRPRPTEDAPEEEWTRWLKEWSIIKNGLEDEIKTLILNFEGRKTQYDTNFEYTTSHGGGSRPYCDLDPTSFPSP